MQAATDVLKRVKEPAIDTGFSQILSKSVGNVGIALCLLGTSPSTARIAKDKNFVMFLSGATRQNYAI
jgi:hypothetical protein